MSDSAEATEQPTSAAQPGPAAQSRPARSPLLRRLFDGLADTPAGTPWHRSPRLALALMLLYTAMTVTIGFLGPSVLTLTLGPRAGSLLPPYYLPGSGHKINGWLIAALGYLTVVLGLISTVIALRAVTAGWRPNGRKLFRFGALMTAAHALVPPLTSADVLMYSAYGRLTALGINNYAIAPAEVLRTQWDPVLRWMEDPWQGTVNVYGAVLTGFMWLANKLGGDNTHDIVFWFQLIFTAAFVLASWAVVRMARGDGELEARALLLTIACPPMLWAVVVGAHNEAVGLSLAILGFLAIRRNPFLAGLLIGAGMTAKATVGIYALAMAWAYRRQWKSLVLCALGGAIPNALSYLVLFPESLETASKNASYVASTSWAFPVKRFFAFFLDGDQLQSLLGIGQWALTVLLGVMLARVLPWRAAPGLPEGVDPKRDPLTVAIRSATLVSAAWLATSAYTLPWYDLMCFLPMALIGPTRLDLIELFRVTALNLGYVLGRIIPYSRTMEQWSLRSREMFSSTVSIGVIVAIVLWWHEHGLRHRSPTQRSLGTTLDPRRLTRRRGGSTAVSAPPEAS